MASGHVFTKRFVPRSAEWYFRQRQQRRALRMGLDGHPIRVEQIAHKENLYHCWKRLAVEGGKGAGVDGYTYTDFCPGEVGQIVVDLSEQVLSGAYFAEPVRSVHIPKKPQSDKMRELKIGTLCDRVLGRAVENAFQGFWKSRFLPGSFGFRKGMGTWGMLADIEVALQRTGKHILVTDDIKAAFDNVPIDAVMACHREALEKIHHRNFSHKEKNRTLALIEAMLRGHDKKHQRGIDQGGPYSPTALNVLLDKYHDKNMNENSKDLSWWRYADNLVYLCQDMPAGRQVLKEAANLLKPLGMCLKGEDGIKNLDQGDHAHLLGFSLWWNGKTLQFEVEPGTLENLRQHLAQSHVTPNPNQTAHAVALGWVEAFAPAYENGNVTEVLAMAIDSGFRESITLMQLEERWQDAWERWQVCRKKAKYHRRGGKH